MRCPGPLTYHWGVFSSRSTVIPGIKSNTRLTEAYCSAVQPRSIRHKTCTFPSSYSIPFASSFPSASSKWNNLRRFVSIVSDFNLKEKRTPLVYQSSISGLFERNEISINTMWYYACFVAATQQFTDPCSSFIAVIERVVIDVHSDKFVGECGLHVAGVGHRVF